MDLLLNEEKRRTMTRVILAIYILIAISTFIYRVIMAVPRNGSETTFAEVMSMALPGLSAIIMAFYYMEIRHLEGKSDTLILLAAIVFVAHFFGEGDLLFGRGSLIIELFYGLFTIYVILSLAQRYQGTDRRISILLVLGLVFLIFAFGVDFLHDRGVDVEVFDIPGWYLEEIPEFYTAMFFLHASALIYGGLPASGRRYRPRAYHWILLAIFLTTISGGNSMLFYLDTFSDPVTRAMRGGALMFAGTVATMLTLAHILWKAGVVGDR